MARQRRNVSVLLLEDVEYLGEVGEIVEVRPGHAHNFLFPSGVATVVSAESMRLVERAKKTAAAQRARRAEELATIAEELSGKSLMIEQRASEEGHLFGSVNVSTIVEALAAEGISVEEKQVRLEAPIKELGIFNVPIQLAADTSAEIRVWVVENE